MKKFIKIAVGLVVLIFFMVACSNMVSNPDNEKAVTPEPQKTETPVTPAPAPEPAPVPEPIVLDLGAGNYVAGTDIPEGTYDVTVVSGSGNFIASTGGMGIAEMMGTDSQYYIQEYKNAKLKKGTEFKIMGNVVLHFVSK